MPDVRVESITLDVAVPMMFRDFGTHVRLAYDPQQLDEASALALLCVHVPRLVGDLTVRYDS